MAQDLSLYRGGETQRSWDPSPLLTLHREMSRLFDDVFLGAVAGQQHDAGSISAPRIDISETDKELRITADLPGVDEENVQVTVDDDVLTIRGETRLEREEERKNYRVLERARGVFQRSIRLPVRVDPEQVKASFENGVLTLAIPKPAQAERGRQVRIGAGGSSRRAQAEQASAQGERAQPPADGARAVSASREATT